MIGNLHKTESRLIAKNTRLFINDVRDHTLQVLDTAETFRDIISGLQDIYLSGISNRMNEVMKTLTIIATIFIPLTFIAGIYGMNFNPEASPWNMPELNWRFGYPFFWVVLLAVATVMFFFFKRKRWL
jgi:magnesium transporter